MKCLYGLQYQRLPIICTKGKQGQYQGVNSASAVGKAFGPLIGGILVDTFNMSAMFGMIVLLLIGMFSYLFLISLALQHERQLEIKHIKYAEPLAIRLRIS